jgi:GH18 family chitinase
VPGAEMDPEFAYKGHFNLLSKYKKQYPDVKTLISVGGWADTRGFYTALPRVTARSILPVSTPWLTRQ